MTLQTPLRCCARRREVLGLVTAFAPTILIPGIRPRSTRWKADEKVVPFFCPQPIGLLLCGGWSPSLRQNGEGHQEKNTDLQDVVNANVPVKLLSPQGPWATQSVLPRLGSSLHIWLVD